MALPAGDVGTGLAVERRRTLERRQRRVAITLVVLAWLVFVFPAFTGKARFPVDFTGPPPGETAKPLLNPELGDSFFAFHPWRSYMGDRLGSGDVPLWDPYRFAGTPFAADITIGVWYPPNWLYASGNILLTFTVLALASILVALLLAYWFFLVVELHPYAAALGAITWVFSAFMMKWSSNEAVFAAAMWLPLALGGLEVARRGRVRRGVLLAATGLGLSVLGGHAQIALLVWTTAAIWFVTGAVVSLRDRPRDAPTLEAWASRLWRVGWPAMLAVLVAGGIAAVQLLPTAEFASEIVRQKTTFSTAQATALPARHVPTALVPDYQGSPVDANYDGPGVNYTETALYAGLLVFPLGALALGRPGRLTAFFAILVVIAILAVAGTPFYRLVLAMPGFSRTLFTTRFILLLNFGMAGLAAVGLHRLVNGGAPRAIWIVLGSAAALLLAILGLMLSRIGTDVAAEYVTRQSARSIAIVLLGTLALALVIHFPSRAAPAALAVVTVVFIDLWMFGSRFSAFQAVRPVYEPTPGINLLATRPGPRPRFVNIGSWFVPLNGELQYRLYGLSGYDPFVPLRIVELLSVAEKNQLESTRSNLLGPFKASTVGHPVLDLLGVTTVVGAPGSSLAGPLLYDGEFRAYDRPTGFPPAWVAGCWELTPASEVLGRLAGMTSSELAGTAVVADEGKARRLLPTNRSGGDCRPVGGTTVEDYQPERVVIRSTADKAGVLVLSDAWFPGWEAAVDGRPVPVLRVDHALRGVALMPGVHTVELSFRPPRQVAGAVVSLTTLVGIVGALALSRSRRRLWRGRRPAPPSGPPSWPELPTGPPPAD